MRSRKAKFTVEFATIKDGWLKCIATAIHKGMGKALSLRLAKEGHEIIMLCRNELRGLSTLEEIKEASGSKLLKKFSTIRAYNRSKLANPLFAYKLAKRL